MKLHDDYAPTVHKPSVVVIDAKSCRVTAENGVTFLVRRVDLGDSYGLRGCLTHNKIEPLIEFYDTRHQDVDFAGGQFVSRYYQGTLLAIASHEGYAGLDLHGSARDWKIDGESLKAALEAVVPDIK